MLVMNDILQIRITPEMRRHIERESARVQLRPSAYARMILAAHLAEPSNEPTTLRQPGNGGAVAHGR